MAKKEREGSGSSDRIARAIEYLHGEHIPLDPSRADWDNDDPDEYRPPYALWNYRLGRGEWATGKIPEDRLDDYSKEPLSRGRPNKAAVDRMYEEMER